MLDILIKNANIIDGSGAPAFVGCVGIQDDCIAFVKAGSCDDEAVEVIDATDLYCTPGFIDCHSHADRSIPDNPHLYNLTVQGITTFVGGNCGITAAPASDDTYIKECFSSRTYVPCWRTFGDWLDFASKQPLGANYVPLVGLNAIRGGVMKNDWARPATAEELKEELEQVDEALDSGAFGLSFSTDAGVPGHCVSHEEMEAIFKRLEDRDSFVTIHERHHQNQWASEDGRTYYGVFRGERGDILCGRYHGILEFIEYLRNTPKLRAMYSHLTNAFLMPQLHSKKLEEAMIEETLDLFMDKPIAEGMTNLYANLIPAEQSISAPRRVLYNLKLSLRYDEELKVYYDEDKLLQALQSREMREKLKDYIKSGKFKVDMLSPATDPYWSASYKFIDGKDPSIIGKTVMEVAQERMPGYTPDVIYNNVYEVLFDIVVNDPGVRWALMYDKREYQGLERLLKHPRMMPMTDCDGLAEDADPETPYGVPLVAYSMFVRYLVDFVKKSPVLGLEEAIHRITGMPADLLRIPGRGRLTAGNYADITLFDLNKLEYYNDFLRPTLRPEGITHVVVNGAFAMKDGNLCQNYNGRVLKP